ncbi:MAG: PAS domain S-box protein [Desulfosarcina sp.]|nr:PAS domain S-box protein [Desulfosarcina sp.]
MEKIKNASLKNKIFFSITLVILLISVLIALFTRWVLISSLTSEIKRRGLGIGHSIAESSRGYILTEDLPQLTSLLFDTRLGDRKLLVVYVFIQDKENQVLVHTFTRPFPRGLDTANPLPPDQPHSIRLLDVAGTSVYDVAIPIWEGIYQIGTVHLGMNKNHINRLIGKLRTTFLGFVSAVTIIFFIISHGLARYITRPISQLTRVSDEISRGNFDIPIQLGTGLHCRTVKSCRQKGCPAYDGGDLPCWYVEGTFSGDGTVRPFAEKRESCIQCPVYKMGVRDEVRQLASSFINMAHRIKESQARLQESEVKYRSLFNRGPSPIFVLERDQYRILDANPRAEEVFGYTQKELKGMPFTDLGPFEDTDRAGGGNKGGEIVISRVQYLKKDGSPIHVNVHAIPARYGDVKAIIVAATDISEMVEKDSQLIQASKMTTLGEMSAGIAHEVNQPLNAIKMGSEFLEFMAESGRDIPETDLTAVVREISGQVDRAAAIIQRLRDFGRKSDFTKDRVQINRCVKSVLNIIGRQLALQNINVELELDDRIGPVMAHGNRIEQVIFNLITNARDAINQRQEKEEAPVDQTIRITSGQRDGHVRLTVADTGVGIPDAVKSRIFEAFFTTKKMGEGMGLGLSITSEIVEDSGGTIQIDGVPEGGTTFTLTFPVAG